jgi:hypothetical protein
MHFLGPAPLRYPFGHVVNGLNFFALEGSSEPDQGRQRVKRLTVGSTKGVFPCILRARLNLPLKIDVQS